MAEGKRHIPHPNDVTDHTQAAHDAVQQFLAGHYIAKNVRNVSQSDNPDGSKTITLTFDRYETDPAHVVGSFNFVTPD